MNPIGEYICTGNNLQTPPGSEGGQLVNVHFESSDRTKHLSLVMPADAVDYRSGKRYRFFSEEVQP